MSPVALNVNPFAAVIDDVSVVLRLPVERFTLLPLTEVPLFIVNAPVFVIFVSESEAILVFSAMFKLSDSTVTLPPPVIFAPKFFNPDTFTVPVPSTLP